MKNRHTITKHEKTLILIRILYTLKKKIPNNIIFWYIFFLMKFLGPLIIINSYSNTISEFADLLRNLVFFKNFNNEINKNFYQSFTFAVYLILPLPLIIIYYVYYQKITRNQRADNLMILDKKEKFAIKISALLLLIILIFSQHIIEMLSISFVEIFIHNLNTNAASFEVNTFKSQNVLNNIITFGNSLYLTSYPTLLLNLLYILLVNLIIYYFIKYSNDISSGSDSRIKMSNSKLLYFSITMIGNLQMFQYYDLILDNDTNHVRLIFIIISLLIMAYPCACLLMDLIYKSAVGRLILILQLVCIFLGIINLIFSDLGYSNFMMALKLAFSGSIAFLIINNLENKSFEKTGNKLKKNFFEENKRIDIKLLLLIIEKLTSCDKIVNNLYYFIEIIHAHKQKCKYRKCTCTKYHIFTDIDSIEIKNTQEINEMRAIITEIIEIELFGSIVNTNSDSFNKNKEFCLLHVDFVFNVKKSEMLAYYLIDVYTNGFKEAYRNKHTYDKVPNIYILFKLYQFKKVILKACIFRKKYKDIKYYRNVGYLKDLNFLKTLIIKNFSNYEKLFGLKQNILNNFLYESKLKKNSFVTHKYDISQAKLNNKVYKFEDIVDLCEELASDYRDLKKYLKSNYSESPLKNAELGFILYNFFILFNKKISFSIKSLFSPCERYEQIISLDSVYADIDMRQPILVKNDTYMNFNIKYISQKLCDMIYYQRNELIDKEMHILLPDIFVDMHSKIVKSFIFVQNQKKLVIESFLITKKNHYFPVKLHIIIFPCLDYNLNILIDLKPLITPLIGCFDEYYFILTDKMNLICFSKGFEDKYSLNLEFFRRLKINFCDLFAINNVLLDASFEEQIRDIEHNSYAALNPNQNSSMNINNYGSALNADDDFRSNMDMNISHFSSINVNDNKNKDNRKKNKKERKNYPDSNQCDPTTVINKKPISDKAKSIEYLIKKDKLMPCITKLKNSIYEKESDKDLYEKLVCFEKKIESRVTDINAFNKQQSIISFNNNNFNRGSTLFKNQKKKGKLDLFSIYFDLVSIGNIPYYIVKLIDLDFASTINNSTIISNMKFNSQNNLLSLNNNFIIGDNTIGTMQGTLKEKYQNNIKNAESELKNESIISFNEKGTKDNNLYLERPSLFGNPSIKNRTGTVLSQNLVAQYSSNNVNSFVNSSVNNPLINHSSSGSFAGKLNLPDNDSIKRLNYDNLNNNIYTKITSSGSTTKPNVSAKKKRLKNFKTQNNKTKFTEIDNNLKDNFIYFFYFSLIILLILLICDYPIKQTTLSFSHKLSEINYYILGMQSEVFSTASAIITACTRADKIDPVSINGFENTLEKIKGLIGARSSDLNSFTYRFFSFLDDINYEGVNELYNVINKEDAYNFMYSDWTTYKRNSTFITQLKNFNYLCSFMKLNNQFRSCRVRERFYDKNFNFDYSDLDANINSIFLTEQENLNIKINKNNNNYIVSPEETLLYYVFENIITIYKNNLLQMTLISNSILESYHKKAAIYLICYNSVTLSCLVFFFFLQFYFLIYYKNKVMESFLNVFTNKNSDKFFEMKLINFKTILECFDHNKCIEYETKKQEIVQLQEKVYSESLNSKKASSKTNKSLKDKTTSIYSNSNRNTAFASKEKTSVRELASLNSAVRLKELKEPDNKLIDIYSNEFLEQVKFNHLDLKTYSFGKYFVIIGALIILALNLVNLVENNIKFDGLIKGNLIACNFLERMPKIRELILYYKISVIYRDVYFIKNKSEVENFHLNYYNISIDVTKEGIFNSLKDSQYTNIYYQFRVIQANLAMFMNDVNDNKIMTNIRVLEKNLNTKDFCFYLAKAYTKLADEDSEGNLYSSFELLNRNAKECELIGNGINSNPLSSILESILRIINNNYFDFFNSYDKNITKFIGNEGIVRANLEIEYIFKEIHDSIMFLIKSDIDSMYNNTLNSEISFSTASIIMFVVFISVFLVFVIRKLKRYNNNLSYTLRRFRKALMQA